MVFNFCSLPNPGGGIDGFAYVGVDCGVTKAGLWCLIKTLNYTILGGSPIFNLFIVKIYIFFSHLL